MADEQYKWLDRDAAESLLRGEPLEAVDADARTAVGRLTGALDALTADLPSTDAELPGEEAALAAFRKARAERDGEDTTLSSRGRTDATEGSADAGLVRFGWPEPEERRARWGRPVRFAMAAALAAGMLGGVAVAAGTGVLPTPFRDDRPEPASTVSAPAPPDRPFVSPSPESTANGSSGEPSPGDGTGRANPGGARNDSAHGGDRSQQPGSKNSGKDWQGTGRGWRGGALTACRDIRDGKNLGLGRMRNLEDAAGGKSKVKQYCAAILGSQGGRTGTGSSGKAGTTGNGGTGSGQGNNGQGNDDQGNNGQGNNGQGNNGKGNGAQGKGGNGQGNDD
ncbi:hypothetical protein [Streptomyces sp. KM273126]|uniref:hypothetical protein n=1 Tax=Streptomyces sp. KM273126 TaxID=2545247 RepID=UPI00215DB6A5|nr:hypothetical protein [Streptomyces sp. KM273126]